MGTDDLLLVMAALIVGAMGISGFRSMRASVAPTGYWALGWAALAASGGFALLARSTPEVSPLSAVLGTLFAPLMLAGALQHVGRTVPRWLLPAAAALGVCGLLVHLAGSHSLELCVPLAIQPALLLLSVWVLQAAPPHWSIGPVQIGFIGLAIVSVADGLAEIATPPRGDPILAWLLVAVPTATLQTIAGFDRVRRSAERTEAERRFEAERFHALLSSLNETPVLLFDRDGRLQEIVGAPREERSTYGMARAEASGLRASALLPADEAEEFDAAIREVLRTGRSRVISVEPNFPAGRFCLEIGLSPVRTNETDIESVIGVVHDVTEHVQAVRALRESEQRLSALLAALAANRVVVIDRSGIIQSVVAPTEHVPTPYGVNRTEIEGIKIAALIPGIAGKRVLATLSEVFETRQSREFEECVRLPAGEFHFSVSLRPMFDEEGQTENVLAVVTDITDRIHEAREREEFEAQVRQAQKLESIGVLAGGIAHDFNNLLTGVLGNVELALEDAPTSSPLHHYLRDIEDASLQAADLTAQLLAYAGKTAIAPSVIELSALVQEMAPLLRTGLVGGAELRVRHIGKPAWTRADATQIRQVLMNLVTNAFEALPEQGGLVEIETRVSNASGELAETDASFDRIPGDEHASIQVRDNGCGMAPETQKRIYEPFYSTKFEGRGLGLAGTLGIVRSHDGQLVVESRLGEGTVFRVLLPLVDSAEPEPKPEATARHAVSAARGTILVVDDERAVRLVSERQLKALGYRAISAASGREALDLLIGAQDEFDASLIDLTMPDWPGERAAVNLRAVREDLPIIFMTGHSERDALERTKGIENARFLAKPFRRDQLATALAELLETN